MDPVTGSLIAAGVGALGSAFGGYSQAQAARDKARREQQQAAQALGQNYQQQGQQDRQFAQTNNMQRAQYLDDRAQGAAALQRRINLNPIADQAAYGIRNMLGAPPAAFQPRDFTQGTMPGAGRATGGSAPQLEAMQTAMQRYTPGAGGMDDAALVAARNRLQSMAGVPGEYTAQSPDQMRLGAEMQQLRVDAANAKTAGERIAIQNRINQLQASMGGGGAGPQVTMQNDVAQAGQDRERAQARNRLMAMLGLGGMSLGGLGGAAAGATLGAVIGNNRRG